MVSSVQFFPPPLDVGSDTLALHALTHCIRVHPLIHRSIDMLSSLTRKNTLQARGHCTRADSLLLSKFLFFSSRWQLRSLTEFSLRETGGKLIKSLQNRAEKRWWINSHYLSHTPLSGTGKIHLMVLSYVSVGLCLSCNPLENQWPEFRVWMVFAKCSFIGPLSSLLQHRRLFSIRHKKYYKIMPNNLPNVAVDSDWWWADLSCVFAENKLLAWFQSWCFGLDFKTGNIFGRWRQRFPESLSENPKPTFLRWLNEVLRVSRDAFKRMKEVKLC